jgi:hypothetical protein
MPADQGQTGMKPVKYWGIFTALFVIAAAAVAPVTISPPAGTNRSPDSALISTKPVSIMSGSMPRMVCKSIEDEPSLPPGVYVTKPYACMILVPGTSQDEIFQSHRPLLNPPMPVIRPDIKIVPLGSTGK